MNFKGKVYFFEGYVFSNGTKTDKLLVFLNNGSLNKDFLTLLTTSQSEYYEKKRITRYGCHSEYNTFYYNGRPFDKPTYIKFNPDSTVIFKYSQIIQSSINGFLKTEPIGDIPENYLKGIINCFKNSLDYDSYLYDNLLK